MLVFIVVVPELIVRSQKFGVPLPPIVEVPLKLTAGCVAPLQVVCVKVPELFVNVPAMLTSVSNLTVRFVVLIVTLLKVNVPPPLTVVVLPASPEPFPVNTTVPDVAVNVPLFEKILVADPPVPPMLIV